jgi:hypothetical protein
MKRLGRIIWLLLLISSSVLFAAHTDPDEKAALLVLYDEMGGKSWFNSDKWDEANEPCQDNWYGITCDTNGFHVTEINLSENNLEGEIPVEIGSFPELTSLNLRKNNLSGKVPGEIRKLAKNLQVLNLSNNNLTDYIDFVLYLTNLRELYLFNNNFSGRIDSSIANLTHLWSLSLSNNSIGGTIPTQITTMSSHLVLLKLDHNRLSGEIPNGMKNMHFSGNCGLNLTYNCDLYTDDQELKDYIDTFCYTYDDIVNSNKCPSDHTRVTIAPIVSYLLSDSGSTPPPPPKPAAPTQVRAVPVNQTSDKMTIGWNDNSNNETSFSVYRSSSLGGTKVRIATVGANSTSYTDSGLSGCHDYYYWVSANNAGGSSWSDYGSGTTAPSAPTNLYTTNYTVRSTVLYWDNNDDGGCTVKYHFYAKYPNDPNYQPIHEEQTFTDGEEGVINIGIQPETYIYYRVAAENSDGTIGPMSCTVKADYRSAPAQGNDTSCLASVGYAYDDKPKFPWASKEYTDHVIFTWDDVPLAYNSNGTAVETYANCFKVEYKIGSGAWQEVQTDPAHCYRYPTTTNGWQYHSLQIGTTASPMNPDTDASVRISTHYYYNGSETYSDPIVITGKTAPSGGGGGTAPLGTAPWVITSHYYPGKIMVGWTTSNAATSYQVYRAPYNVGCQAASYGAYRTFNGDTSSFDDMVGDWKEYCYKVRACNASGCTNFSHGEHGSSGGLGGI